MIIVKEIAFLKALSLLKKSPKNISEICQKLYLNSKFMHTYTIVLKVICKISAFLFFLVQNSPRRIIGSAPQTPRKEKRPKRKGFLALLRKRLKSKRSRTTRETISMPSHELSSCKSLLNYFFSYMAESRIILKVGFVGKKVFLKL